MADNEKKSTNHYKTAGAVLLILLFLAILLLYNSRPIETEPDNPRDGVPTAGLLPGSKEIDLDALGEDMIRMQINSNPVFSDGKSQGNLYIGNPDTNDFDMQVTISTEADDQILYDSVLISPGYYIDFDKLKEPLQAGDHNALAVITYYTEQGSIQTQTNVQLVITVES